MSIGSGRAVRPSVVTASLTATLAVAAFVLTAATVVRPLPGFTAVLVLGLGLLFAAAEAAYVSVEFRRQTYSFTMAGVPLVLGLLALPPAWVVLARVAGSAAVLFSQRLPVPKAAYNLAAFAFETALAGWLLARWGQPGAGLTLQGALVAYATLLSVDVLMSALVMFLIRLHGGDLRRSDVLSTLLPAGIFNAISLTFALVAHVLIDSGPLGWALLVALSAVSATAYRAHTHLAARHQALEHISDFVEDSSAAETVAALAGQRIARVRTLLGAESATAVLGTPDSEQVLHVSVDADDVLTVETQERAQLDWLFRLVQEQDEAVLLRRGVKDVRFRRWLTARGLSDAVVVPLRHGPGLRGVLMVADRQADHATFTADDVKVLRTLAGYLGVALRGTRLLHRLRYDATHDILTSLANRALLQERLDSALDADQPQDAAVLLLDLDGFKEVNDALGHGAGDRLLQVVGERLAAAAPEGATVARLGGDEFAVLVLGSAGALAAGLAETAELLARTLAEVVAVPVVLEEGTVSVEASIGIATSADGRRRHDLLRHADTAMYAAKAGPQAVQRYTQELDRGRAERLALLADLRLALERDELLLRFQPKVDLATGRTTGAEALVRWQHPRLGLLSPDVFIPIAESTGLIEPLTRTVLRLALLACRDWRDQGLDLTVAVNLSARLVSNPDLPSAVQRALLDAGLPAGALVLEITESSVMGDRPSIGPVLEQLVALGVTLSLDDFGTGYSSLAYLQRLPVQEVKIDQSFVTGLSSAGDDKSSTALISSIVGLGRAFGLRIVAEGVEDEATLARLAVLGCDVVQGYLLGRPVTSEVLARNAGQRHASLAGVEVPRRPALVG